MQTNVLESSLCCHQGKQSILDSSLFRAMTRREGVHDLRIR